MRRMNISLMLGQDAKYGQKKCITGLLPLEKSCFFGNMFDLEVFDNACEKFTIFVDAFYIRPMFKDTPKTYFTFNGSIVYFCTYNISRYDVAKKKTMANFASFNFKNLICVKVARF